MVIYLCLDSAFMCVNVHAIRVCVCVHACTSMWVSHGHLFYIPHLAGTVICLRNLCGQMEHRIAIPVVGFPLAAKEGLFYKV